MADKSWKAFERRIAHSLGTKRNPLSGSNSRHSESDSLHPKLFIECKLRKRIPFMKDWDKTKLGAKKEKKIPIVVFHEKKRKENIVMMSFDDFEELYRDLQAWKSLADD